MNITFQYPAWLSVGCILLGLLYAMVLYYKDTAFNDPSARFKKYLLFMAGARFLVAALMAFLLLSPLVRIRSAQIEKPVIVIAQDNSASIRQSFSKKDTAAYRENIGRLITKLEKDFSVKQYSFGEKLKPGIHFDFRDRQTNMSQALEDIYTAYANQNLGAVILASDGLYNSGSNPVYLEQPSASPVYVIALGDTTQRKDLLIAKTYYNQVAYLGDKLSLKVDLTAWNCKGERIALTLSQVGKDDQRLFQKKNIPIPANTWDTSAVVVIEADKAGIQHYRIALGSLQDEVTLANNVQDIFIEVLDGRQKILLLANSPHPDLSAFRQAIESNKNYEVKTAYAGNIAVASLVAQLKEYGLVILHQLPSRNHTMQPLLEKIRRENIPVLFVIGAQTSLPALNAAQAALQINGRANQWNEAQATVEKDFSLFSLSSPALQQVPGFPPLQVPYGEYKTAPSAQSWMKQKVGALATQYPLLIFDQQVNGRSAILCGEGIWRWRLNDFLQNKTHEITNELLTKIVQYLSAKSDKRQFRVIMPERNFNENEPVSLDAELYDDSYRLINAPDAELRIYRSDGKEFPFVFNKTENAYTLQAGYFATGNYQYQAKTRYNGKELVARGEFSVSPLQLEALQTTANHSLLYLLSQKYGGKLFYPDNLEPLFEEIKEKETIKPVAYATYHTKPFIHLKWFFFLLMILLAMEWGMRKWNGAY